MVWAWDFLLCGFLAAVSRPLLANCFSVCDLRLFVMKRMLLSFRVYPSARWRPAESPQPPSRRIFAANKKILQNIACAARGCASAAWLSGADMRESTNEFGSVKGVATAAMA